MVPDLAECKLNVDLESEFKAFLFDNGIEGSFKDGTYKVIGKSAHAMDPTKGVNACTLLCTFLNEHIDSEFVKTCLLFDNDGTKIGVNYEDAEMGLLTMNLGFAKLENGEYKIGVNNRVPQGWDMFEVQEARVNELSKYVNVEYIPVHYVPQEDELVKTLMASYVKYTGDTVNKPITIGGGTYARALDKAVAFGPLMPGRDEVAHQKDEYMHLSDLFTATAIYADALYNLSK
jgi:succinyl-diaminopimelate desuccinylase